MLPYISHLLYIRVFYGYICTYVTASSSRRLNFENCQLLLNFGRSGCFILTR